MNKNNTVPYIDEEEKDLIESLNAINVNDIPDPDENTQNKFKEAATLYMKIRINPLELERIKQRANVEGLKYQAFVKSVLHKYLTGQLVEKKSL